MARYPLNRFWSTLLFAGGVTVAALAGGYSAAVAAKAPAQFTQAPGYYRLALGDIEITALSDGVNPLPMHQLLSLDAAEVRQRLAEFYLHSPLDTSVNGFLVNDGKQLVLIDTGAGDLFGDSVGRLQQNLQAAGYSTDAVDVILLTHLHSDHVGGLLKGDKPRFSHASVYARDDEVNYWLSDERLAQANDEQRRSLEKVRQLLAPYQAQGRLVAFSAGDTLAAGIHAVATPGHTPGHTSYRLQRDGQRLWIWGDIVHAAAIQFADPSVTIAFDSDAEQARQQRQQLFAELAKHGDWIAGAHLSFPGIGHIQALGDGHYRWLPANYTLPQPAPDNKDAAE
ncbi:MBL fold metallo-hydrolase [Idiomarina xiamenensis]|uniref:Methyl parathion hydrolase n=1 Tax=Idiomarina xiamenensis 10-D-4 TaxID=740709 RepID=K2KZ23_9GAMM|nr:MBL fold metallo-hydrolase [Idiomarina xiamenensis]EKE82980.1 methyl parathion hydrolase [Idiomarina xiamenensis 10-D-4]